jgi:cell division protease FtsH
MAKQMVFELGMGGEEFVAWGSDQGPVFLGGEISRRKDFSEETARELEGEVNKILGAAYEVTETVIGDNWVAVEGVANALLQRETVEGTLIEKAYERAREGMSAEAITQMIVDEVDAAERRMVADAQRAAEADRQRRAERPAPTIDPRPASQGPRG